MLRAIPLLVCLSATLSTLAREVNVEVDGRPYFVVAADFNHDGHIDFAVSGATYFGDAIPFDAYFLSLYEADGRGNFSLRARISTGRSLIASLSVGDINNNGFEDLVTPLEVFFDISLVGFVSRWPVPLPEDARVPYQAATGDFNGDGRDDVAVADLEQRSISFFTYENGLKRVTSVSISHYPNTLITTDVDRDGMSDVVTGATKGTVSIVYVTPEFRFREVQTAPVGMLFLQDIALTDLNGDSLTDVVALDQFGPAFVFFNSPEAIMPIHELRGTERAFTVIADDVTGDAVSDVVIGKSDGLSVFEFDQRGDVKRSFAVPSVRYAFDLATADLNGDGFRDILITGASSSHVTLIYGPLSPAPPPARRRGVRP